MLFKDFVQRAVSILQNDPSLGDLPVFQTSCFDHPYRFEVGGIFLGEMYTAETSEEIFATFSNEDSAIERVEEEGEGEVNELPVIVIEAF